MEQIKTFKVSVMGMLLLAILNFNNFVIVFYNNVNKQLYLDKLILLTSKAGG